MASPTIQTVADFPCSTLNLGNTVDPSDVHAAEITVLREGLLQTASCTPREAARLAKDMPSGNRETDAHVLEWALGELLTLNWEDVVAQFGQAEIFRLIEKDNPDWVRDADTATLQLTLVLAKQLS